MYKLKHIGDYKEGGSFFNECSFQKLNEVIDEFKKIN